MSETLYELGRDKLRELLLKLKNNQRDLFYRLYVSVEKISDERIDWAIQQCERTIKKNEAKNESA